MSTPSPIERELDELGAVLEVYGEATHAVRLAQTIEGMELEYAAIRKGAGVFDEPHAAYLELTGDDRLDFLNRMLTQELAGAAPGDLRASFWLNRKGRIVADLRVMHFDTRTLLEMDIHVVEATRTTLEEFIFTEDVAVATRPELHRLGVHGPDAGAVVMQALSCTASDLPGPGQCRCIEAPEGEALLAHASPTGEPGLGIIASREIVPKIHGRLRDAGARPIGWQALNIARIEAGTPLFLIDFAQDALPAETGLLDARVSFTKGCYLGQEVVARMHALGHPKRLLRALRLASDETDALLIPDAGTPLLYEGTQVGHITSATLSPMLSRAPIALGMVRWGAHELGTVLELNVDGRPARAAVQDGLAFWLP